MCTLFNMKLTSHYIQYRCVLGLRLLIVRFHTLHSRMYRKIKQKIIFKKIILLNLGVDIYIVVFKYEKYTVSRYIVLLYHKKLLKYINFLTLWVALSVNPQYADVSVCYSRDSSNSRYACNNSDACNIKDVYNSRNTCKKVFSLLSQLEFPRL
jgi:hypothetical protein